MTQESKAIAWTAVILDKPVDGKHYSLGLATEGEPGYAPIKVTGDASDPLYVAPGPTLFDSYAAASNEATIRNNQLGLSQRDAAIIVASTMRMR